MMREINTVEGRLATTAGTCAVMGTASTMACIAEALGMMLPGTAAIPAVHADRLRAAEATGVAAVQLARAPIRPSEVITAASIENAFRVLLALGGFDQRCHPPDRSLPGALVWTWIWSSLTSGRPRPRCW